MQEFKPLEFDEEAGTWSWPPEYANPGSALFKSSIAAMEDVMFTLAREPGGFIEASGSESAAMLMCQRSATGLSPKGNGRQAWTHLEALGLVELRKVTPKAKKFKRMGLTIPVSQIPGKDPHPPKHASRGASHTGTPVTEHEEEFLDGFFEPRVKPMTEDDEDDIDFAAMFQVPAIPDEIRQLGAAMIDDLIQRATATPASHSDRNHISGKLEVAERRVRVLEKDLEAKEAVLKSLRVQFADEVERGKRKDRNLKAALDAARDLAAKAGVTLSQDTQREIERMAQAFPRTNPNRED